MKFPSLRTAAPLGLLSVPVQAGLLARYPFDHSDYRIENSSGNRNPATIGGTADETIYRDDALYVSSTTAAAGSGLQPMAGDLRQRFCSDGDGLPDSRETGFPAITSLTDLDGTIVPDWLAQDAVLILVEGLGNGGTPAELFLEAPATGPRRFYRVAVD